MKLSENFNLGEFACKGTGCCDNTAAVDMRLVKVLQRARTATGSRFRVNSGFRCIRHNAVIGGVENSYHTMGWAADIVPLDTSLDNAYVAFEDALKDKNIPGCVIMYKHQLFIHVDVRTTGKHRSIR